MYQGCEVLIAGAVVTLTCPAGVDEEAGEEAACQECVEADAEACVASMAEGDTIQSDRYTADVKSAVYIITVQITHVAAIGIPRHGLRGRHSGGLTRWP